VQIHSALADCHTAVQETSHFRKPFNKNVHALEPWGLAGTSGAISAAHYNTSGTCMWIQVLTGVKIFFICAQEIDSRSFDPYHTASYENEKWYSMVLQAGDVLYSC
jgi:hypothetical protein